MKKGEMNPRRRRSCGRSKALMLKQSILLTTLIFAFSTESFAGECTTSCKGLGIRGLLECIGGVTDPGEQGFSEFLTCNSTFITFTNECFETCDVGAAPVVMTSPGDIYPPIDGWSLSYPIDTTVDDPMGLIERVDFYLSTSENPTTFLGSDSDGSDGYGIDFSPEGLFSGNERFASLQVYAVNSSNEFLYVDAAGATVINPLDIPSLSSKALALFMLLILTTAIVILRRRLSGPHASGTETEG